MRPRRAYDRRVKSAADLDELLPVRLVRGAADPSILVWALTALLPDLGDEYRAVAVSEILAAARAGAEAEGLAHAAAMVAPYLPQTERTEVLGVGLSAARGMVDPYCRASALAALAPHLAPPDRLAAVTDVVGAALEAEEAGIAVGAVVELAPQLEDDDRAGAAAAAFAALATTEDWEERHDQLARLAPYLPDRLLATALDIALRFDEPDYPGGERDAYNNAAALAALAPRLSTARLAAALTAARAIPDPALRASALMALAPALGDAERGAALRAALAAAGEIRGPNRRACVLVRLAPHLTDVDRASAVATALDAVAALTPRALTLEVAGDLLREDADPHADRCPTAAITISLAAQARAELLTKLAPLLSAEQRHRAGADALETIRQAPLPSPRNELLERLRALAALLPHVPQSTREPAATDAFSVATSITDPTTRAFAIAALAPSLADRLLPEALAAIATPIDFAEPLIQLVPHLPVHLTAEALDAAAQITRPIDRARAIARIADHAGEPWSDLAEAARGALQAATKRGELLAVLDHLAPLIGRLSRTTAREPDHASRTGNSDAP